MPFSASTCLTNTGSTPLNTILSAYTDFDSYNIPFSYVNLSQITGAACPYIFTDVPDGTTNIRLIDPTNSCCVTIPIQSDNFCNTCDLGFTTYPLTTNSQILAGDLTGSCFTPISNYVINWYGPNSSTNIAFRSGKGNTFSSLYQFTHPLTGSGFVFAQAGTYTPVIDRVIISGITFSNTGGTGTYDANLDCFEPVVVSPLTCDNGNTPSQPYTHSYYFSGTGASSIPLNVTFQLANGTNFFAYSFSGQSVPDNLKITYNGVNTTPNQMVVENINVGTDLTTSSLTNSAFLRSADFSSFKKVLSLTSFTNRSANDSLTIQITPNPGNTEWSLNLKCLPTFDCSTCIHDNFEDTPMKIVKSSITVDDQACYSKLRYSISACTWSQISGSNVNVYAYYNSSSNPTNFFKQGSTFVSYSTTPNSQISKNTLVDCNMSLDSSQCNVGGNTTTINCGTSFPSASITYNKYLSGSPAVGVIDIVSNESVINYYLQSFRNTLSGSSVWVLSACTASTYPNASPDSNGALIVGPFSGGTFTGGTLSTNNPSDPRYYRSLQFVIPTASGSSTCGSNSAEGGGTGVAGNFGGGVFQRYRIHTSSVVSTGSTGASYSMRITMPTTQNLEIFSQCRNGCQDSANTIVNEINTDSTGTTNFFLFNSTGAVVNFPFLQDRRWNEYNCSGSTACTSTAQSGYGAGSGGQFQNDTIPWQISGLPPSLTQYTSKACEYPSQMYHFNCTTNLVAAPNHFKVWCNTITNFQLSPSQTLAYEIIGNTEIYCNPNFVIGC